MIFILSLHFNFTVCFLVQIFLFVTNLIENEIKTFGKASNFTF